MTLLDIGGGFPGDNAAAISFEEVTNLLCYLMISDQIDWVAD